MMALPGSVKVYLWCGATDLRRSYDALSAMVRVYMIEDPLSGHLFVFCNRRRTQVKVLYWDRDGFAVWQKRLERGTFRIASGLDGDSSAALAAVAVARGISAGIGKPITAGKPALA